MSSSLFFPFSQAASVATLSSALLCERFFARCQLGVLDSVVLQPDSPAFSSHLSRKAAHSIRHSSEHGDQLNLDQRAFR
jgi:hypothetical protein